MSFDVPGLTPIDVIGRGGFGVVHRAADAAHGREVAVKVLPRIFDESARRRFDRERKAMGTLSGHPNIAIVHTSGFTGFGEPYIVMEMLSGGSFADHLERHGPLAPDAAIDLGQTLAGALDHAHRGGVLHLDLKPENILLSEYGVAKLVDFGIAALIDEDVTTTTIRATPAYADPVVLDGHPGTEQSDVYGLAATLYHLLEGVKPYGASDTGAYSVIQRVAVDPVPRITRADVPSAFVDLIQRAMSKEPAGRPASMAAFAAELAALDGGDDDTPPRGIDVVSAVPSPPHVAAQVPIPHAARPPDRSRSMGIAFLALAALLLAIIVGIVLVSGGDEPKRELTDGGPSGSEVTDTSVGSSLDVVVPDVIGETEAAARAILEGEGLDPAVGLHCNKTVVGQDPAAGETVRVGDGVAIRFAACVVPDFVGTRLAAAVQVIEEIPGMSINWPDHCDDLISAQSIPAGTVVEPGTTIDLVMPSEC